MKIKVTIHRLELEVEMPDLLEIVDDDEESEDEATPTIVESAARAEATEIEHEPEFKIGFQP